MAKSLKRVRNNKRLGAYLAAGAGSLGMVSAAEAGVVSINIGATGFDIDGPNAGLAVGAARGMYNFPFAGGGGGFLGILNQVAGYTGFNMGGNLKMARNSGVATDLKVFGNNASIGYGDYFWNNANFKEPTGTASDIGANKYLGFQVGSFGNYNYGYLEVTWTSATNTFEIKSAAYESTPNTPILAGAASGGGGAVPEPASGAIAALLMGGTALRQWRKKRRQESNEAVAS